jgi:hypothetical protein
LQEPKEDGERDQVGCVSLLDSQGSILNDLTGQLYLERGHKAAQYGENKQANDVERVSFPDEE